MPNWVTAASGFATVAFGVVLPDKIRLSNKMEALPDSTQLFPTVGLRMPLKPSLKSTVADACVALANVTAARLTASNVFFTLFSLGSEIVSFA